MIDLNGRVAIVTGSGTSVGRAVALSFASQGATTVVNDIDGASAHAVVDAIREVGGLAHAAIGDARDSAFMDHLLESTATSLGHVDVMHCNVGHGPCVPLLELTDDQWRQTLDINLTSAFIGVRAALRVMVPQGFGSIVCTASLAGLLAVPGTSAYGAAKAGVMQLVRCAAVEYASSGVRVNAIAPGTVVSPALDAWAAYAPELRHILARGVPQGRLAEADDIAAVACWLASDSSAYVNGVTVPVDGGTSAKLAMSDTTT